MVFFYENFLNLYIPESQYTNEKIQYEPKYNAKFNS